MKLKIETLQEKANNGYFSLLFGGIGILSFIGLFITYIYAFIFWICTPEMIRFAIGVIVINIFIFIRFE